MKTALTIYVSFCLVCPMFNFIWFVFKFMLIFVSNNKNKRYDNFRKLQKSNFRNFNTCNN